MKVLMYGWEYPPFISGGLGVACHAIVQDLTSKHIEVNLLLPCNFDVLPENKNAREKLIGVDIYAEDLTEINIQQDCLKTYPIDSLLHPYLTPHEYLALYLEHKNGKTYIRSRSKKPFSTQHHTLDMHSPDFTPNKITGRYGPNLFQEVLRYAKIAGDMAIEIPHDVIHAHDWMTILAGINAKQVSSKPLIFHIHALEIDRSGMDNINQQIFDIEKYGMQEADRVIAVSNYTKRLIMQHYHIPEKKIAVIHNGIDKSYGEKHNEYAFKHPKTVLFLGRITHQKGPYFFIEIAKKILSVRQDIQFVLAGTGNLLVEMIEKVACLHIGKNVHFTGFLDPKTVKKLFHFADVYVMPSVSEPFGISCLEALANDVPVVISKQSGAAEVLHDTLSADFWDVDEMAGKILALLD
ncbi:MAG: glycosyltransferase, partial [Gammaproteobacteria bacterium]